MPEARVVLLLSRQILWQYKYVPIVSFLIFKNYRLEEAAVFLSRGLARKRLRYSFRWPLEMHPPVMR